MLSKFKRVVHLCPDPDRDGLLWPRKHAILLHSAERDPIVSSEQTSPKSLLF